MMKLKLRYVEDLKIEANGCYSLDISFEVDEEELERAIKEAREKLSGEGNLCL